MSGSRYSNTITFPPSEYIYIKEDGEVEIAVPINYLGAGYSDLQDGILFAAQDNTCKSLNALTRRQAPGLVRCLLAFSLVLSFFCDLSRLLNILNTPLKITKLYNLD
mgnify:CR=1 FL=1